MLKLEGKEMLSKEQMKKITGGDASCWFNFFNGEPHLFTCEGMDAENCERLAWLICTNPVSENCRYVGGCVDL